MIVINERNYVIVRHDGKYISRGGRSTNTIRQAWMWSNKIEPQTLLDNPSPYTIFYMTPEQVNQQIHKQWKIVEITITG